MAIKERDTIIANELNNCIIPYAKATGTVNNYEIKLDNVTAYYEGLRACVLINIQNTGKSYLNVNGLGKKILKDIYGNEIKAGELLAKTPYQFCYNGNCFILLGKGDMGGTATSEMVLSGYTFMNKSGGQIGTMPNKKNTTSVINTNNGNTKNPKVLSITDDKIGNDPALSVRFLPDKGYYDGSSSIINLKLWGVDSSFIKKEQPKLLNFRKLFTNKGNLKDDTGFTYDINNRIRYNIITYHFNFTSDDTEFTKTITDYNYYTYDSTQDIYIRHKDGIAIYTMTFNSDGDPDYIIAHIPLITADPKAMHFYTDTIGNSHGRRKTEIYNIPGIVYFYHSWNTYTDRHSVTFNFVGMIVTVLTDERNNNKKFRRKAQSKT